MKNKKKNFASVSRKLRFRKRHGASISSVELQNDCGKEMNMATSYEMTKDLKMGR